MTVSPASVVNVIVKLFNNKNVIIGKINALVSLIWWYSNNDLAIPITKNENKERRYNSQVVYPIISDGDVIGTVILLSKDNNTKMNEVEQKVAQSAASFLGSQMEI